MQNKLLQVNVPIFLYYIDLKLDLKYLLYVFCLHVDYPEDIYVH